MKASIKNYPTNKRASIVGIRAEMAISHCIVCIIYASHGYNCALTSGTDFVKKRKKGSRHPIGGGLDYGVDGITYEEAGALTVEIREALGDDFDVVFKGDHIHTELDPEPLDYDGR